MFYRLSHAISTQKAHYLLDTFFCSYSDIKSVVNCKQSNSSDFAFLLKFCIFLIPDFSTGKRIEFCNNVEVILSHNWLPTSLLTW